VSKSVTNSSYRPEIWPAAGKLRLAGGTGSIKGSLQDLGMTLRKFSPGSWLRFWKNFHDSLLLV